MNPTGILVLLDRLLVADSSNNMILEYLLNGTFVNYWNLDQYLFHLFQI